MSAPIRIDLTAAAPTEVPADHLAWPIVAGEATLSWLCPVCGKLRVFEGGRPLGPGHQDECQECGSALFAPQSRAARIRVSNHAW